MANWLTPFDSAHQVAAGCPTMYQPQPTGRGKRAPCRGIGPTHHPFGAGIGAAAALMTAGVRSCGSTMTQAVQPSFWAPYGGRAFFRAFSGKSSRRMNRSISWVDSFVIPSIFFTVALDIHDSSVQGICRGGVSPPWNEYGQHGRGDPAPTYQKSDDERF